MQDGGQPGAMQGGPARVCGGEMDMFDWGCGRCQVLTRRAHGSGCSDGIVWVHGSCVFDVKAVVWHGCVCAMDFVAGQALKVLDV